MMEEAWLDCQQKGLGVVEEEAASPSSMEEEAWFDCEQIYRSDVVEDDKKEALGNEAEAILDLWEEAS